MMRIRMMMMMIIIIIIIIIDFKIIQKIREQHTSKK